MLKPKIFALVFAGALLFTNFAHADQSTNPALNSGASANSSYNWAGYVSTGGTFTSVTGSWIIPQVPASGNLTGDATWVGIGGVKSQDLIQTGTEALTGTDGSGVIYKAWYETLPGFSKTVSLPVNAGDSITASITQTSANKFSISLKNNTTGQNYQTVVSYNSSLSSAEWVQEMPSQNSGFIPLDNFGSVQFTNGSTVKDGASVSISNSNAQPLTMQNFNQELLATPSSVNNDGSSFTVNRTTATASSKTPSAFTGRSRGWTRRQNLRTFRISNPSTSQTSFQIPTQTQTIYIQIPMGMFARISTEK